MTNKKNGSAIPDFESTLKKLESIVTAMESGELPLEQALKQFEEGVALSRQCQLALQDAELRINQLMTE